MKTFCSVLFAGCLLFPCDAQQQLTAPPAQPQWTKAEIVGLTIELIDPAIVESMTFTADGAVILTVGQKNGPITAPVFFWEFLSGRLRITSDGKQLYDELTLISRDATTITVRRHNAKVAKYKIVPK